ncbi:hypothetical protein [Sulfitobacter sp. S190]|uniref:hypothetical protein n=1 Tax=Sulfitobacter sp. S190 TaxID=2867022 RepID=UPI0021A81FD7|nr:hypothetical protein [Sulfitobacter sp. S190]UWR23184.1 hypothetical protein K3756_04095 [Sulfitobacter sp. S190]
MSRHPLLLAAALIAAPLASHAAEGTRVQVTGEIIDTWCYYSGVMGGPDAVVGTAHHTCALWCSAGGIPVGILGEDGDVYTVLKVDEDDQAAGGDTLLSLASYNVTADGMLYERDGIKYIVVGRVEASDEIINQTHEDYGVIPGFAIPEPK